MRVNDDICLISARLGSLAGVPEEHRWRWLDFRAMPELIADFGLFVYKLNPLVLELSCNNIITIFSLPYI